MKLRKDCTRYSVGKHGKDYVDPEAMVLLCPECQSLNVRKHEVGEECSGVYLCLDCGCEFDQWKGSERTELGEAVSKFLTIQMVLCCVAGVASLIGGLIYAGYLNHAYPEGVPDSLELKAVLIGILGPIVGVLGAAIFANISEKV